MSSWYEQKLDSVRDDPDFKTHQLLLEIIDQITDLMESEGIRKSNLAERLGVSRAYVTAVLEGKPNLTIRSLVRLASALGSTVDVKLSRLNEVEWWRPGVGQDFEMRDSEHTEAEAEGVTCLPIAA